MKAGQLNHRIEFVKVVQTAVAGGGTEPSYETYLTTNANVEPLKQDRTEVGNQSALMGGYTIICRYRRDKYPDKTMLIR